MFQWAVYIRLYQNQPPERVVVQADRLELTAQSHLMWFVEQNRTEPAPGGERTGGIMHVRRDSVLVFAVAPGTWSRVEFLDPDGKPTAVIHGRSK